MLRNYFRSTFPIISTNHGAEFTEVANSFRTAKFLFLLLCPSELNEGIQIFITMCSSDSFKANTTGLRRRSKSVIPKTEILRDVMTKPVVPTSSPKIAYRIKAYASENPPGNPLSSISRDKKDKAASQLSPCPRSRRLNRLRAVSYHHRINPLLTSSLFL